MMKATVKQAQDFIRQGFRHVVDMDLEKFYDKVNHDILMSKLAKRIKDKRILKLIREYLQAGIMDNGCYQMTVISFCGADKQGKEFLMVLKKFVEKRLKQEWIWRKVR